MTALRGALALAGREWRRFYRQRGRVTGTLGTPLILWGVMGLGFGESFRGEGGAGYLAYFYPGTIALQILFTAVFANIAVIEDRQEGFLLSVLVTPLPRWAVALGQIAGGASIALVQAVLMLGLVPFLGLPVSVPGALGLVGSCALLALGCDAVGYTAAWTFKSSQGFHAFMNVALIPVWLLSGAVFPSGSSTVMRWIMAVNPMTYGIGVMRACLGSTAPGNVGISVAVTVGCTAIALAAAFWRAGRAEAES